MNQKARVFSERRPVIQKKILRTKCQHAKLTTSGFRPPSERRFVPSAMANASAPHQTACFHFPFSPEAR